VKVFKVFADADRYQVAHPVHPEELFSLHMLTSTPVGDAWTPPAVRPLAACLPEGDFYNGDSSNLITGSRATAVLYPHLAYAGELLPLPYGDKTLTLLNVTACYDLLDEEHTEFYVEPTSGTRIAIRRYAFHLGNWPNVSLFKIPQNHGLDIMVAKGVSDLGNEFRALVRQENLKGLLFQEIWDSEGRVQGPEHMTMPYLPAQEVWCATRLCLVVVVLLVRKVGL